MDIMTLVVLLVSWAIGLVVLYFVVKAAMLNAMRQRDAERARASAPPVTATHLDADGL